MNIHPIFVHFPVALLTIYAILEILHLKKLNTKTFIQIKTAFLLIGSISLFSALSTGELAAESGKGIQHIVQTHELYAKLTTAIFGLLSINYFVLLVNEFFTSRPIPFGLKNIWTSILSLRAKIYHAPVLVLLAIIGLIVLTITGSLGGYMVYGAGNDFITDAVVNLILK